VLDLLCNTNDLLGLGAAWSSLARGSGSHARQTHSIPACAPESLMSWVRPCYFIWCFGLGEEFSWSTLTGFYLF